jgi:hypothetical protein
MRCPEVLDLGVEVNAADTAGAELGEEGFTIHKIQKGGVGYARI